MANFKLRVNVELSMFMKINVHCSLLDSCSLRLMYLHFHHLHCIRIDRIRFPSYTLYVASVHKHKLYKQSGNIM